MCGFSRIDCYFASLQVRSHAQKHFIRLEKTGFGAGVPPARRKARGNDKLSGESLDGSADSDQDGSGTNYQANSSTSTSSFDYHQARASAGSSTQCSECQPITCSDHNLGSFQSCTSSVSSSPSQSVIAHAQVSSVYGSRPKTPLLLVAHLLAGRNHCRSVLSSFVNVPTEHSHLWLSLQEFLRCCNSTGPNAPAAVERVSCPQAQGMVPQSR